MSHFSRVALRPLLISALLLSSVHGQDPFPSRELIALNALAEYLQNSEPVCSLSIDGPKTATAGQLVRLDAVVEPGTAVLWHLVGGGPNLWDTANNGSTVFFASPSAGTFTFVAAASCSGSGQTPELRLVEHVVTVTGPSPGPVPPGPNPPPAPKPVLPAGKFGVAQSVFDGVSTLPAGEKTGIAAIANNYSAVAAQCAAGTIPDLKTALAKVRAMNEGKLADRDAHMKAWGTALSQRIGELSQGGKLPSADDWRILLEEIALGLRTWGAT